MEIHITATFPDTNPAIQNFVWSDGAWVSFNAETKEWANHGTIPHPTANPTRFGELHGTGPSRRATDALEVVPLADAPRKTGTTESVNLCGYPYRVRDGVLEYQTKKREWVASEMTLAGLKDYPNAAPLIAALTAEPPRHSAEVSEDEYGSEFHGDN